MPTPNPSSSHKDDEDDSPDMARARKRIEKARREGSRKLDLSGLQLTSVPESLGQLTALQDLDLSRNQLTSVPETLGQLTSLRELRLYSNQLRSVPEALGQLTALQVLNLGSNKLTSVPEALGQLTALREFNLARNQLTSVPEALGQLTALQQLHLDNNQLTSVPEALGQLTALREFNLARNQLTSVPEALGQLTALQQLHLDNNQLTALPDALKRLTALQILYVFRNQLTSLPEALGHLTALRQLNIYDNQLTALPDALRRLPKLVRLYLHGNPGLGIPEDALGPTWHDDVNGRAKPKPAQEILDYYFATRGLTKRPLNEAKLVLVGRGGAGKTSLRKRLLSDEWDEHEDKTPGIAVTAWPLTLGGEKVQLNVWDFGGQEIMHATHQFFLTRRSLYVLVLNAREGEQDVNVEYWLRLIAGYGDASPALVVVNKCEQHPLDLDERGLREKFPFIQGFVRTDCRTRLGLPELRAAIERATDKLPDLRTPFPEEWFGLKRKLAALPGDCITYDDFRQLCRAEKEPDETNQDVLVSYLHDLGTVLHFRDDHRLNHLGVLKPDWVTQGIYGLLNAEVLKAAGGVLGTAQLGQLLEGKRYPQERHGFLLQLMEKFELCFELPDTGRRHFLIPELLPKETPVLDEWKEVEALGFEYHYNILPEGLLPRFIVRTHAHSEGQKRWRSGVVLGQGTARALVRADVQERVVTIAVCGPGRQQRDLLAVVRGHFEEIHRGIAGLHSEEKVPVPGYPAVKLAYRKLLVREASGKTTVEFETETETIELLLGRLLDNFETPESRHERAQIIVKGDYIAGDKAMSEKTTTIKDSTITGSALGDGSSVTATNSFNSGVQSADLAALVSALRQEFAKLPAEAAEVARPYVDAIEAEATKEKPNQGFLTVTRNGLNEAAKTCAEMAPSLVKAATAVVEWFTR